MDLNDIPVEPNILAVEVTDIVLKKYKDKERISLLSQFLEINVYQSIFFNPLMKAELLINDPIGLHVNFPLLGEETIEIWLKPTRIDPKTSNSQRPSVNQENARLKLEFMISDVKEIIPDDKARSTVYALEMYSVEMYHNAKWTVQRAFKDQYHNIAKTILTDYLDVDKNLPKAAEGQYIQNNRKITDFNFEASKGTLPVIVPNMRPLEAIKWCARRAVAENEKNFVYMFWETFEGFHFKTLQETIETEKPVAHRFYYFADVSAAKQIIQEKHLESKMVTGMSINKRYSTIEKIVAGFYENEYYEIDVINKTVNSTQTSIENKVKSGIYDNQMNTDEFLEDAKYNNDRPGTKTRVRYAVGQNGGDDPEYPNFFATKFGEAVRSQAAFSQVSLTISVPGHTDCNAGDVVELILPEMHGFNIVNEDRYLSGYYIITDIKHSISVGMNHVMVLNLARDSYTNPIKPKMEYNTNAFNPTGR